MSGIRDILVAYDGLETARSALSTGLSIASRANAHVTGCYPYTPPEMLANAERWMTKGLTREFREIAQRIEQTARDAVQDSFREISADFADPERLHWLKIVGNADIAITKAARHFDLTLIGKGMTAAERPESMIHPDVVALRSGKPVLVVPEGCTRLPEAGRVVIAWDGKRAAARTVSAGINICLGSIGEATVLAVGKIDDQARFWLDQMVTHLGRHDIRAVVEVRPTSGSVSRTIIDCCAEVSADMLMMGAYEHSKFSEDILGGTTNDVMRTVHVPVFMAH